MTAQLIVLKTVGLPGLPVSRNGIPVGPMQTTHAQDVNLRIHVKGVYSTKVSLLPLSGSGALKAFIEKNNIPKDGTVDLTVPKDRLPGQFVLRFDYVDKPGSTPYPAERYFFIGSQNLEIWANPKAVNNPDSTYFQKGERENALFAEFSKENGKRKAQLSLLQNFLMNYDQPKSKFYQTGYEEYESRRKEYNQWLTSQIKANEDAFVSRTFQFQYVPQLELNGTEKERMDNMNFNSVLFKNGIKRVINGTL